MYDEVAFALPRLPRESNKYYILCVSVALITQHAMIKRRIILLSVACLALPFSPHYLTNGTIFGRILLKIKCVFLFPLQLLSETFLILRITEGDIHINVHMSSCSGPDILVRLEFSPHIFGKCSNIKFHENPSSGSRVVPFGRTHGRTRRG
jgi:hypothetical protein